MDWIFARGAVAVTDAELISESENDRYPSDHYFIAATANIDERGT